MAKSEDNSLVISAPRQGISLSPHTGFADIRNLDITSIPGIVRLNKNLGKRSSTTVTGLPNWAVRNPLVTGEFFVLDNAGKVYRSTNSGLTWAVLSGNSTTDASGNGLAIWKDYLFVARDANLDVFGPLSSRTIVSISNATPGIVNFVAHGFSTQDGTTIIFSTSGALPTGLVAGTVYYVGTVHNANEFSVSATQGGADINTSSAGSGTHKFKFWRSSSSPALTFKAIDSDVDWHPMLVSKNDSKLYGGAGRYVYSLEELTTFDPTAAASYTWTAQALDLPSPYRIKCIEELNGYLMLGTWQGTLINDFPVADIFPWDRSSTSFGQPVVMKDFGIHAMLNVGNSLVVLAGTKGSIYRSDGVNYTLIGRLPIDLSGTTKSITWSPGAICNYKDKVYFGSGGSDTLAGQGVYSLEQTSQGNILNLEHLNSQETDGSAAQVVIGALIPITNDTLLFGWLNSTDKGIDTTSDGSYAYTSDYQGFFDSPLYQVGTPKSLSNFTSLEILFAKKLATGEGLRIQYRTSLSDSFTTLGTFTNDVAGTTILGAKQSHFTIAGVPRSEFLQLRVALLGTTTTTPQLRTITFS